MSKHPAPTWQPYAANARKTFKSALSHWLHTEFPGIFGPTITQLVVDRIDALYEQFHPPASHFHAGQVFWVAVAADDRPARQKRIETTRLVPVVLDLVTARDIDETAATELRDQTRCQKILRLFRQAYAQKAVLSLADVSLLLHLPISTVARVVREHEAQTQQTIPRRGTIHDLGRSLTHKAVICYKRLVQQKSTSQVAQETCHSPEEVEYYVQSFRRIQLARDSGLSQEDIARTTGYSSSLIQEYLQLMEQFPLPPLTDRPRTDSVQSDQA